MTGRDKRRHILTVAPADLTDEVARFAYRVGYRKAGDALVLRVLHEELSQAERHGLIYPIMFLYRHCIELTLKDLLALGAAASIGTGGERSGHDLGKLWSQTLSLAEEVQGDKMRQEVDNSFGPLVLTMQSADPRGDGFRYSSDNAGGAHWSEPFDVDVVLIRMWVKAFEAWCRMIEEDTRARICA